MGKLHSVGSPGLTCARGPETMKHWWERFGRGLQKGVQLDNCRRQFGDTGYC